MLDRRSHGDDAFWPRHLYLEVGVLWGRHELGVARTPMDGVVRTLKPHHVKGRVSLQKLSGMLNQTGRSMCQRGWTRLPGATPGNSVVLGCSWSNPIPINRRV
jgi:hypothetical protein